VRYQPVRRRPGNPGTGQNGARRRARSRIDAPPLEGLTMTSAGGGERPLIYDERRLSMSDCPHSPEELRQIYGNRFDEHMQYRNQVWQVLTAKFFSKLIPADARVLDLGCGYGEFINNIQCAERLAMDMNPAAAQRLHKGIAFIEQDSS